LPPAGDFSPCALAAFPRHILLLFFRFFVLWQDVQVCTSIKKPLLQFARWLNRRHRHFGLSASAALLLLLLLFTLLIFALVIYYIYPAASSHTSRNRKENIVISFAPSQPIVVSTLRHTYKSGGFKSAVWICLKIPWGNLMNYPT
jgi:hypothetical protein